jgi:hypothetical protein
MDGMKTKREDAYATVRKISGNENGFPRKSVITSPPSPIVRSETL